VAELLNVMLAHSIVAFAGYFVFGGWRFFAEPTAKRKFRHRGFSPANSAGRSLNQTLVDARGGGRFDCRRDIFDINVGMGALAGAVLLAVIGAADEAVAIRAMPWGPILMVSGVTVLISLLEKTGGMDLFTTLLARFSSEKTVTGVTAFLTGSISVYSSTSGVVLPAFLPTVPGLITKLGGGDAMAIASSMNVGAHLVDVSPLSTTGALCIAAAPPNTDIRSLFRKMLAWGLSMALVAAAGCYLVFGLLWTAK
jgi:di/tricarboxylate transporter